MAAFAWLTMPVQAQVAPAGTTPIRTVRFTVFSAQRMADVAFVPRPNAAPQKLIFQPTAKSVRYEYRGPMPMRFVDATTGGILAEAAIPAGIGDALLLFSPIEPGKGGGAGLNFQIAVLDDGALRHGPGGLSIINLSGLALKGTVNRESLTLKAGLNPTVTIPSSARVVLTTTFKNRVYQSYAGTLSLKRNERALLILFPPFNAGGVEVQSRLLIDQPPGTSAAKGRN